MMIAWVTQNGGRVNAKVEIVASDDRGLGFQAMTDIGTGELLFEIPKACMPSLSSIPASSILQRIDQTKTKLHSSQALLACLLTEEKIKKDKSFFAPYIQCLPKDFRHHPLNWSKDELSKLQSSCCVELLAHRKKEVVEDYETLGEILGPGFFEAVPKHDYLWSRMCIQSRVYETKNTNKTENEAMVPILDLSNHTLEPSLNWSWDEKKDLLRVISILPIKQGSPMSISYGSSCNSRYLINYGFCLEQNPFNTATVTAVLRPGDPYEKVKMASLSDLPRDFQVRL